MDLFDAIKQRHSYRGAFRDVQVPREDLIKIVQAGIDAPSGCNAQTTDFIIIDDHELIAKTAEIVEGKTVLKTAAAVIAVVMKEEEVYHNLSFGVEDYSAAVENMLLAITALGYATVWLDGVLRRENRVGRLSDLLMVPDGKIIRVILPLGIPVEKKEPREKRQFSERAFFNVYPQKT